jgi:hypothetical protein
MQSTVVQPSAPGASDPGGAGGGVPGASGTDGELRFQSIFELKMLLFCTENAGVLVQTQL